MISLPEISIPPPGDTVGDLLHASLAASVARTFEHLPHVDEEDPEQVHQARVGVRRLRSNLKTFRAFLTDDAQMIRSKARALAGALGDVRDLDVLRADLDALDLLPATEWQVVAATVRVLGRRRRRAARAVVEYVDGAADLLEDLRECATNPPVRLGVADEPGERMLAPLQTLWRKLEKRRALPVAADEDLHRTRIRVKRLRYGLEAVAPLVGKRAKRSAKRAAAVQQLLGAHQDAVVARRWLLSVGRHLEAPASTVYAELAGFELARRSELRRSLPKRWQRLERSLAWL